MPSRLRVECVLGITKAHLPWIEKLANVEMIGWTARDPMIENVKETLSNGTRKR
jgi:hypothetical protein